MKRVKTLFLSKYNKLLFVLSLFLFFRGEVFLQLTHEIKIPLAAYQKTNIYSDLTSKYIRQYREHTSFPGFEYTLTHRSGFTGGVGLNFHYIYVNPPIEFMRYPEYTYRQVFHNFTYLKIGYTKSMKSLSIDASLRITRMAYNSYVSFSCKYPNWWESSYDAADFRKYNAGLELGLSQTIYKGLFINLSGQYYLPQPLSQDNCLEKLPDNFHLFQTVLRFGYRFQTKSKEKKTE